MAWVAPRTWTDGEVVTAAMFNQDLRDNQSILKVPREDDGRISGFASGWFANLSASGITNIADPDLANTFTAGKQQFSGATLLRIPVGTDKYDGVSGNKTPGSVWVEGDYLHHVDDNQDEWRYLGDLISVAGAQPGFLFISGTGLRYTDADGDIRECVSTVSPHTDSPALASLWIETYTHWIQESNQTERQGHSDVSHVDTTTHNDHSDHTDVGGHDDHDDHTDSGSAHADHDDYVDHTDGAHVDFPFHSDHTDHNDYNDHDDYDDHFDSTNHSDHSDHSDTPADSRPEFIGAS